MPKGKAKGHLYEQTILVQYMVSTGTILTTVPNSLSLKSFRVIKDKEDLPRQLQLCKNPSPIKEQSALSSKTLTIPEKTTMKFTWLWRKGFYKLEITSMTPHQTPVRQGLVQERRMHL